MGTMWRKLAWIYVAIYAIGVSAFNIMSIIKNSAENGFDYNSIFPFLLFLVPAAVIAFELLGMIKSRWFVLLHIAVFLFVAFMTVGNIAFNTLGPEMLMKALLFIPMLGCLGYYIYTKLAQKKPAAAQ